MLFRFTLLRLLFALEHDRATRVTHLRYALARKRDALS